MEINKEEIFWLKLQDYAERKLSAQDTQEMDAWVANNEDAQITLAGLAQIANETGNKQNDYFKQQEQEVIAKHSSAKRSAFPSWLSVAASLVLLAGISVYFLSQGEQQNTESLLATYTVKAYQESNRTRTAKADAPALPAWEVNYQNGKFEEASQQLLESKAVLTERESFYLGVAQFNAGNYSDAIVTLSQEELKPTPANRNTCFYCEQSQWYLGLSYLKANQHSEAKPVLLGISQTGGFKHKEAETLLNSLE